MDNLILLQFQAVLKQKKLFFTWNCLKNQEDYLKIEHFAFNLVENVVIEKKFGWQANTI